MRLLFSLLTALCIASCSLSPNGYKAEIAKMEDTLFKAFPTVNRVSIEVKNDFGSAIIITLGDAELYNADEAAKADVVDKTKAITLHVFGHDKMPGKGEVVFVKEENTINVDETAKKVYDMHLGN